MSDPVRLVDGEGSVEKSLLESWAGRQPANGARLKTLAAVAAVTAGGFAGGAIAGGAGASLAPKAVVVSSSALKWVALVGGIAATLGAVAYVAHVDHPAPTVTASTTTAPAPAIEAVPSTSLAAAMRASLEPPAALPVPPAVTPAAPASVAATKPAHASPSSLDEEVLAIDHARQSLAGGDYAAALDQTAGYDARYPTGALVQESAEIRIEALFRSGKRAQAEKLAARFLAQNPASPYARVIRALASVPAPTPE